MPEESSTLSSGLPDDSNIYTAHRRVETNGIEVFVEAFGESIVETFPGEIVGLASAPNVTHFINSTVTLTSTVRRVVSSIRRDVGGSCSVFSNTNIVTFDGVAYSPNPSGYSVLAQTLYVPSDPNMRTFTVVANGNDVTITTNGDTLRFVWGNGEIATTLNNNQITLTPGENNVDGDTQIYVALSQLSAGNLGMLINVTTFNNDVVQIGFYDASYIFIYPNPDLYGHLVGLCGTWDNCVNNEFIGSNGAFNPNAQQQTFVNSWNVPSYTYNTALFTGSSQYFIGKPVAEVPATVADSAAANSACTGVRGALAKFCNYDAARVASAAAVYKSIQASTCEQYCQSGFIASSLVASTDCDFYCPQNFPPFDLFNLSAIPATITTRQNVKGLQNYINVFVGGKYYLKATDSEGIVDYTTLEFNCSEELVNISAGHDVTVTRSPSLGFPEVQLLGDAPQNYAARAFQFSWKPVVYPYIGQDDNTTSSDVIAAQAPVIISGTSLSPRFTPTLPGKYIFTMAVYDGCMLRYSNVSVTAVCDNCPFTSRINPSPTVFWNSGLFARGSYSSFIYAAPQYIAPGNQWSIPVIQPYNVRNENLTVVQDAPGANTQTYHIVLTTGTPQPIVNSSQIPELIYAGLQADDTDASPIVAYPITLTTGLVYNPTRAVISDAHHHRWDYLVVTTAVNVVAYPQTDFNVRSVCDITLSTTTSTTAGTRFTPRVAGVADYCTGKYSVQLFVDDYCHNSTDVFVHQVECDSRPILNAPGCRDDVTVVYQPFSVLTTGWIPDGPLDGTNPYDTEEVAFTYAWTVVSRPPLSRTNVTCATPTCAVQPDFAGDYVVQYTISDGCRYESALYTMHAVCYQERYISQTFNDQNPVFSGTRVNVQFTANSTIAKATYLRQTTTHISLPSELSNLPPFGNWGNAINGGTAAFSPNAKGTWNVDYSVIDECGVLNVSTVPVTYTCQGITGTPSAVIAADHTEVESSGAYPAINLDGTGSSITSSAYTPQVKYYWYRRPAASTNVADWFQFSTLPQPAFVAPSAGSWEILLIFSDDCEYATTTITVVANCLPPVLTFEVDGFVIDENGRSKIVDTDFPWYDQTTSFTLNSSESQNVSTRQWLITAANGDVYTFVTYNIDNPAAIQATLTLFYPTPNAQSPLAPFTIALQGTSACGATTTTPARTLVTHCAAQYNGFLNVVTVAADKNNVNFLSSNRFDSSTITASVPTEAVAIGEPIYRRFLVTQAPTNSIYAPYIATNTASSTTTVRTVGPLNNTGFNGQYDIYTSTTTTAVTNTWIWVELEQQSNNRSYYVCFTPDVSGTYVITTELRDSCNNTRTFQTTVAAGCPTPITFSSTPNITIDTQNFRDLARVSIDASAIQASSSVDLKFRWTLSYANGTYDETFNGTYFTDIEDSVLTNYYGSVVSFVLPYTYVANTYNARYDIWDGCQTVSGYVNVSIPAIGHRNIFVNSVAAYNPNATDSYKVESEDSIAIGRSQFVSAVAQDLRQTDCYSAGITYEVVGFQSYVPPPPPAPKKKGTSKGVIAGAVVGSVAGAAILGAAIFGIMKYKARSVAV